MSVGIGTAIAIGGISAAGSLGSAYIGSRAAGNASRQQAAAGDRAAELFNGMSLDDLYRALQFSTDHLSTMRDWSRERNQDERVRAMEGLDPYRGAGQFSLSQLMNEMGPDGRLGREFTADTFREYDPGYNFRLDAATTALNRSAFARGNGLSGATLQALTRYSQDYADNAFTSAHDRWLAANNQRYQQLMGLGGLGLQATGMDIDSGNAYADRWMRNAALFDIPIAQNTLDVSRYASDFDMRRRENQANAITGAGNARAAGTYNAGQSWAGAAGGAASGITNAILLSTAMGNQGRPTASSGSGSTANLAFPYMSAG